MSPRRRRRTTYYWGEGKPSVYIILGCMAVGALLIYFLFFPPDFTWKPTVKVPATVTPVTNPLPPAEPAGPATQPVPAEPAVTPPTR